MITKKLL